MHDFGINSQVLTLYSQVLLLQHKIADSRRLILKNRCWNSIVPNQEKLTSNLYNTYSSLALGNWLKYSPFFVNPDNQVLELSLRENLCMQAASLEFKNYPSIVQSVLDEYSSSPQSPYQHSVTKADDPSSPPRLTVAWLSADISYHPVGRFILGLFSSIDKPKHNHILVDVNDHASESKRHWFDDLNSVSRFTPTSRSHTDRLSEIRGLKADIAIDLSGWTSGHFMRGFYSRLAQVQVSYLGYFASTGIPQMDFWLGDSSLFPSPMTEWHSESIWRLPRCFIAWNPPVVLPEANVDVVESVHSRSTGIHFGSFNHHRKLSDETLIQWGKLLSSILDRLVLKSGQKDDQSSF